LIFRISAELYNLDIGLVALTAEGLNFYGLKYGPVHVSVILGRSSDRSENAPMAATNQAN
jgi:hypothetical protein